MECCARVLIITTIKFITLFCAVQLAKTTSTVALFPDCSSTWGRRTKKVFYRFANKQPQKVAAIFARTF